jgi:hypothetical protein
LVNEHENYMVLRGTRYKIVDSSWQDENRDGEIYWHVWTDPGVEE